ncbi:MAG: helix-turn-helix transcriptional regulator, partial [Bacteroidetes bacterium]|nr:helix-turn-helix transcriptional regulator [Bacteroidota bacterium]
LTCLSKQKTGFMKSVNDIGGYLQKLRKENKMSLREVAEYIGIDISLLSKIEHGERQLQTHMIKPIAELFNLKYRELQIQFLNQKIEQEFGGQPYLKESLEKYLQKIDAK